MCGRFTQNYTWAEVHAFLSVLGPPRNLQPHYNIAPTRTIDVIRLNQDGKRELVPMRWGLIPGWWKKSPKEMPVTFNARAESVDSKPMFRNAFKGRRCIIPASGFYEWTGEKGDKQPHLFTAADGSPILAFAGLWDRWHDPESGEEVLSCTIIVCGASEGPVANSGIGRTMDCADPSSGCLNLRETETDRQQPVLLAHRPGAREAKPLAQPE